MFSGGKKKVVDGPFAETKELIAGFWLWQVKSMEEAIEWVRRCPDPMPDEESVIEIRPVFEAEDFGKEFTPGGSSRRPDACHAQALYRSRDVAGTSSRASP